MASSNIKLFDENKGNMLNDTEFNISTQRINGLQTGVASSQLQNKAMYQASLVTYAIAQLMLANGQNANDTDAVSTFVNNLLASIVQKKLDKATKQDVVDGTIGKWISSELLKSNNEDIAKAYLKLAGGTMSGDLFLNADPKSALQAATKNYIDKNFMKLEVAKYTGSGSVGASGATVVTFPYPIKYFAFPNPTGELSSVFILVEDLPTEFGSYRVNLNQGGSGNYMRVKRDNDCRMISWYAQDTGATAAAQLNAEGVEYRHMYAGYYDDSYGPVDRLITASGVFVVEKTGKYYIELYGGGGGGHVLGDDTKPTSIASGGSSCQSYSGVQLNKGDVINVVIGAGGAGSNSSHSPGANGGTTSFGSLSVAGGGGGSKTAGGTGSGNLGKSGEFVANPRNSVAGLGSTVSDGVYGADYGYGGGIGYNSAKRFKEKDGGAGAVFIRYEGQ